MRLISFVCWAVNEVLIKKIVIRRYILNSHYFLQGKQAIAKKYTVCRVVH